MPSYRFKVTKQNISIETLNNQWMMKFGNTAI